MKIDKIYSQIIALTKEIYFNQPKKETGKIHQFFANVGNLPFPLSGIALKWWYSKRALKLCADIAKMATEFDDKLRYGDVKDFSQIIRSTLEKNATNKEIFQIFLNNPNTLFESRTESDVQKYSKEIWDILHTSMLHSLTKWLILYPLSGIISNSFKLQHDGLHIIRSSDYEYWNQLKASYPELNYLDFVIFKDVEGHRILNIDPPESWLACEISETENKARFYASLFMRKFIAVLFSFLRESNQHATTKSMRKKNSYCLQIPSANSNVGISRKYVSIGILIHPIINKIELRDSILDTVNNWYNHCRKLDNDKSKRVSKASHFLNYALITDGIHQFLYFFIVLDALFGERNEFRDRIIKGIGNYLIEPEWQQKIAKIINLRSDLVHGGSSYIEAWPGYDSYVDHFNSSPERDIEIAATKCLREYVFTDVVIGKPYKRKQLWKITIVSLFVIIAIILTIVLMHNK